MLKSALIQPRLGCLPIYTSTYTYQPPRVITHKFCSRFFNRTMFRKVEMHFLLQLVRTLNQIGSVKEVRLVRCIQQRQSKSICLRESLTAFRRCGLDARRGTKILNEAWASPVISPSRGNADEFSTWLNIVLTSGEGGCDHWLSW